MTVRIETDRLRIREFVSSDANALYDLYSLPETSQFESWSPHETVEESQDLLNHWIQDQSVSPRESYTFALEFDQKFIGLCGLDLGFSTETDDTRVAFLGYRITPAFWGQGIATEAASALLGFGFRTLNLHRVLTGCSAENVASVRVIEKLSFRHEGTSVSSFPIEDRWTNYHLYGMLKDEYQTGT